MSHAVRRSSGFEEPNMRSAIVSGTATLLARKKKRRLDAATCGGGWRAGGWRRVWRQVMLGGGKWRRGVAHRARRLVHCEVAEQPVEAAPLRKDAAVELRLAHRLERRPVEGEPCKDAVHLAAASREGALTDVVVGDGLAVGVHNGERKDAVVHGERLEQQILSQHVATVRSVSLELVDAGRQPIRRDHDLVVELEPFDAAGHVTVLYPSLPPSCEDPSCQQR